MTSKNKHINKFVGRSKSYMLFVASILLTLACLGLAVLNSHNVLADESPKGQIPTTSNFDPSGESGENVPFTFWQKIDNNSDQPVQDTYTYIFFPIDENGNKLDIEQPFPGEDPESETGHPVDAKEFVFTMIGNQTKIFYINFKEVPLLTKYKTEPFFKEKDGWYFNYRSQMVKPDPAGENFTYDDTYFDVKVWIPHSVIEEGKTLRVFCFNPIGEKVYDPGWTITYTQPPVPPAQTPPQTVDPNWVIAITAVLVFAFCVVLAIAEKRKRKAKMQAAIDAAKNK